MTTATVEWADVGLVYDGDVPVVGLQPTSMLIERGSYVAITGPSGSGKSSLLSVLGLLSPPTSGTYRMDGRDVTAFGESERARLRAVTIGFVFQAFHLVPSRTALDNVALRLMYQGVARAEALRAATESLSRVGLADRLHHMPGQLSGGQCQRVAIARAIVGRPRLLLADEPTGNLDSQTSSDVLSLIEELRDDELTLVVVTHSGDVAARAEKQIEVRDGQVMA